MLATEIGEIRLIPLGQLRSDPDWERTSEGSLDQESLRELADSIKERGILEPLRVYEMGNGQYLLNSGHRRAIAARSLKLETVPCYVLPRSQERIDEHINRLVVNIHRKDIGPLEKAKSIQAILDANPGMTRPELATMLAVNTPTITTLLTLLRLPVGVQDLVQSGALGWKNANVLTGISLPEYDASGPTGRRATDVQIDIARTCVTEGWGFDRLRDWCADYAREQARYISAANARTPGQLELRRNAPPVDRNGATTLLERELKSRGITVDRGLQPLSPSKRHAREENERNAIQDILPGRRAAALEVVNNALVFDDDDSWLLAARLIGLLALDNPKVKGVNYPALKAALNGAEDIPAMLAAFAQVVRSAVSIDPTSLYLSGPDVLTERLNDELEVNAQIHERWIELGLVGEQRLGSVNVDQMKTYHFLSPWGERVPVHGLASWCRAQGLPRKPISRVVSGHIPSYQGWRLDPNPEPDDKPEQGT